MTERAKQVPTANYKHLKVNQGSSALRRAYIRPYGANDERLHALLAFL